MRVVIQRVSRASVSVSGRAIGEIGEGLCVLVGAMAGDSSEDVSFIARKLASLRIFHDEQGKMNRSVADCGGAILLVSQFTLAADTTSGTRPSFSAAMQPRAASELLDELAARLREVGLEVATGEFGAVMDVEILNNGPVTIVLDSRVKKKK